MSDPSSNPGATVADPALTPRQEYLKPVATVVRLVLPYAISISAAIVSVSLVISMWSAAQEYSSFQVDTESSAAAVETEAAELDESATVLEAESGEIGRTDDVGAVAEDIEDAVEEVVDQAQDLAEVAPATPQPTVEFLWFSWKPSSEELFPWLAVLAGVLGSAVASLLLLMQPMDDGSIKRPKWMTSLQHIGRPFLGAALALVVYFGIRGGLLNLNLDSSNLNPYGLVFVSALVGMFTHKATDKLSQLVS